MSSASILTRPAPRQTRQMVAQQRFHRRRRRLAALLERALDPRPARGQEPAALPLIPVANRRAVAEPLLQLVALLRDPAATISKRTLRLVLEFATDPGSPVHGTAPSHAEAVARSLVADAAQGRALAANSA